MTLPLTNLTLLDFTHLLPGELCSTILTDLGCNTIRIESLKPGLAQRLPPIIKGESLYYWSLHRNKQRIALNLKSKEGIEIVNRLIKKTDIILENFRPGVMTRLGIGYNKAKEINNKIIFCSISGYGQNSKFSTKPGHDLNFQAEAGVLNLTRQANGAPLVSGILVSDYTSASYAALSIVSTLYERDRMGKGRHLDISMFESTLSTQTILSTALLYTGEEPKEGNPAYRDQLANYSVYECKDNRYLAVASLEPQFWIIFCERIGRPDLVDAYPLGPSQHLKEILADIIVQKTLSEWVDIFVDSNCCVSPVNTLEEALKFMPSQERPIITEMYHPTLGKIPQLRTPVPFDTHRSRSKTSDNVPLDMQANTKAILKSLEYSENEINNLAQKGIILGGES